MALITLSRGRDVAATVIDDEFIIAGARGKYKRGAEINGAV